MIFLEQFTLNVDNKFSVANKITFMSGFNINYLNQSDKNKMESIITPYGLKLFYPDDETRVSPSAKIQIDCLISDYETNKKFFCFDALYKTGHFDSLVGKNVKRGKILPKIFYTSMKIIALIEIFLKKNSAL